MVMLQCSYAGMAVLAALQQSYMEIIKLVAKASLLEIPIMNDLNMQITVAEAYQQARALRAAYIRRFFRNLFGSKPTSGRGDMPHLGGHAAA